MNSDNDETEPQTKRRAGQLTGWEDVIFELDDEPVEESVPAA